MIRPQVVGPLKWVKASYKSGKGLIAVEWRIAKGRFALKMVVPRGVRATVSVPSRDPSAVRADSGAAAKGGGVFEVGAGSWKFSAPWSRPE